MNQKEIWRDIPKFEGVYTISNMGNVKRLAYERRTHNGGVYEVKERLLNSKNKLYFTVNLQHEGYSKFIVVNRLVYSLFNGVKIQRNHLIIPKDGNFLNCRIDNLKLITRRNFVSAKMINATGYTGVTTADKYGQYTAKIVFEAVEVVLYTSKDIGECNKLYQAAKTCIEEYDRMKLKILSNSANNRLINKKVKL